jgi:hypothetical protein
VPASTTKDKTMKKFNTMAGMAAVAMTSVALSPNTIAAPSFKLPSFRGRKRYPGQSTRQAMRGMRRAQGGPGIDLCPHLFEYVACLETPF